MDKQNNDFYECWTYKKWHNIIFILFRTHTIFLFDKRSLKFLSQYI